MFFLKDDLLKRGREKETSNFPSFVGWCALIVGGWWCRKSGLGLTVIAPFVFLVLFKDRVYFSLGGLILEFHLLSGFYMSYEHDTGQFKNVADI